MAKVAERFLTVFQAHGVARSEIQQFLPEVTLDKLHPVETLLGSLTDSVLTKTAELFGVRRSWLDGVDDAVYDSAYCYKSPKRLFNHLASLQFPDDFSPLRALYTGKNLDAQSNRPQPLVLVSVESIREISDRQIYRYTVFHDGWDWSYRPTRIQLKAMVRVLDQHLRIIVPLYRVSAEELDQVRSGLRIPHSCFKGSVITEPSLEDYALDQHESRVAKECDELPAVKEYIAKHKLDALALGIKKTVR